jgi:ATP-dependent DNA helicase RecG
MWAGKTVVALDAMLIAVEAGLRPRCWRRPKSSRASILKRCADGCAHRRQHRPADRARQGPAREGILMGLMDGSIDILVGTHAIFQDAVAYRTLPLL